MIRSFVKLQDLDLGFQSANVLTAQIFLPGNRYPVDPGQFRPTPPGATPQLSKPAAFYAQLMETLSATPGIESIGAVSSLPLNPVGIDYDLPVLVEGRPRPRTGEEPQADFRMATPDYFRTMRIALKRGRLFTEFDGHDAAPVAIINETMANQMFPGEDRDRPAAVAVWQATRNCRRDRVGEAPRLQPRTPAGNGGAESAVYSSAA